MNSPTPHPANNSPDETPRDTDLAEQAVPGHGIPSQDPNPIAQVGLTPKEAEREVKSAYVGGGAIAGLAAGAVAGAAIAGPLGVLVGGTAGTIAGALGGEAAGHATDRDIAPRMDHLPTEAEMRSADDDGGEGS